MKHCYFVFLSAVIFVSVIAMEKPSSEPVSLNSSCVAMEGARRESLPGNYILEEIPVKQREQKAEMLPWVPRCIKEGVIAVQKFFAGNIPTVAKTEEIELKTLN